MIEPPALVGELLTQHGNLVLDERYGAARTMGDMQLRQHLWVVDQEVWMAQQIGGDGLVLLGVGVLVIRAGGGSA
jgi:hypothetical protein